LTVEVMA